MNKLILENIKRGLPGITDSFGGFMSDCAVFCFASEKHESGIFIKVKTDTDTKKYEVVWDIEVTDKMRRTMSDPDRTTEFGAMCMAILMTLELTPYKGFEVSQRGTGVDFWLYEEDSDDLDLSASARLEISGIRKATTQNSVTSRLRIKKNQVKQSSSTGLPAYIAITEFSKPDAAFVKK